MAGRLCQAGRALEEITLDHPTDALAHMMEMQGRERDDIAWMRADPAACSTDSFFRAHNGWHLALYHLELGEIDEVLALYDGSIRGERSTVILDMTYRRRHWLNIITAMPPPSSPSAASSAAVPDPLARLNPAQCAAVEHGITDETARAGHVPAPAQPLLVIAGAGSGKTNTLAHRVAHLIAHGADPGRILLLTFSRRAADEMGRRVRRILAQASAGRPGLAQYRLFL